MSKHVNLIYADILAIFATLNAIFWWNKGFGKGDNWDDTLKSLYFRSFSDKVVNVYVFWEKVFGTRNAWKNDRGFTCYYFGHKNTSNYENLSIMQNADIVGASESFTWNDPLSIFCIILIFIFMNCQRNAKSKPNLSLKNISSLSSPFSTVHQMHTYII